MEWIDEFNRLKPHVEAALARNCGTQSIDDVQSKLQDGKYQMWTSSDAIAITQVMTTPNKKHMHIIAGGGNLDELRVIDKQIEKQAIEMQCNAVTIVGRRGWKKALPGYVEKATVYMKEL